ncbi:hypothetical protein L218DRAFT_951331 [Marasmius fiardii PR-910]|nr:hypothetical protein L218DRAFT_951331 [Marasmius fiardii PR-910]
MSTPIPSQYLPLIQVLNVIIFPIVTVLVSIWHFLPLVYTCCARAKYGFKSFTPCRLLFSSWSRQAWLRAIETTKMSQESVVFFTAFEYILPIVAKVRVENPQGLIDYQMATNPTGRGLSVAPSTGLNQTPHLLNYCEDNITSSRKSLLIH